MRRVVILSSLGLTVLALTCLATFLPKNGGGGTANSSLIRQF